MGDSPATPPAAADRPRRKRIRPFVAVAAATVLGASAAVGATVASASTGGHSDAAPAPVKASASEYKIVAPTSSPIKHVVVLFDENESFDHYFGTYPNAANTDGTAFHAKPGTPRVNGLSHSLLTKNANSYNPNRLTHSEALTCDQNHGYTPEQEAFDGGKMDKFVQDTETDTCTGSPNSPVQVSVSVSWTNLSILPPSNASCSGVYPWFWSQVSASEWVSRFGL